MLELKETMAGRENRNTQVTFVPASRWRGFAPFLRERAVRLGDRTALDRAGTSDAPGTDSGSRFSYADLHSASLLLADRLISLGIGTGSHVAILAESGPEWGIAFFGTMIAGAVLIPLDPKSTLAELQAIASDCRPSLIFASGGCREKAGNLVSLCGMESGMVELESLRAGTIEEIGARAGFADKRLSDTALIVYTSGTTGAAKGVLITIGNLVFQMEALVTGFRIQEDDRFLSILPMNHLLELTCGLLGVLHGGAQTIYCASIFPADVTHALRTRKATYVITVPYFLRLLARQIGAEAGRKSVPRRLLFACWQRLTPVLPDSLRRRMFHPVHQALGGRMRGFISGGAPLDADTEDFLARLGIRIYQGYGLTETSPVISANRPGATRARSVGRPLPGVELRIRSLDHAESDASGSEAPDGHTGEILTRGPHVMAGYHGRADLTGQALDPDGWFHTGDVGHMDGGGFLHITGRIKSLIVLEGGKKIHPEEVEDTLSSLRSIKEACVLNCAMPGGKEELVAVIVPHGDLSATASDAPARAFGLGAEARLRMEIAAALAALSAYKRPARIVFFPGDLPRTASRKIRREDVKTALRKMGT